MLTFHDIKRAQFILKTIIESGFGGYLEQIILEKKFKLKKYKKIAPKIPDEKKLRIMFEKLGPTFIKLGQLLSVRPDLVPSSYCLELEKLQDSVPSFDFSVARQIIEQELKGKIEKLFKSFDKKPIASASVSQVYKAILPNGKKVAVKVQRPAVQEIMLEDIRIMRFIAGYLEKHTSLKQYSPLKIVNEFEQWTLRELDFRNEVKNMKLFYEKLVSDKNIIIPKPYEKYCTSKVIVMDFLDGIELKNISLLKKNKVDVKKALQIGLRNIFKQLFELGLFHADPHPSNVLVIKDKKEIKLGYLDFGIVGSFDKTLKRDAIDFLYGVIDHDSGLIVNRVKKYATTTIRTEDLEREIDLLLLSMQSKKVKDMHIGKTFEQIVKICHEHGIIIPTDFILFAKAIATLEGIALVYDPNLDIYDYAREYAEYALEREYKPKISKIKLYKEYDEARESIKRLLDKAEQSFDVVRGGELKVDIDDIDVKRLALEIDRSSNRLSYGIIIGALILAGSFLINYETKQLILGLPVPSFIMFLVALLLAIALLSSIVKERKLKK